MTTHRPRRAGDRRGVAAVEFAFVAPLLLTVLGGATDFGLVKLGQSQLVNGLAQGVQYALLTGPSATAANIKTTVRTGASNAGLAPAVTVTVTGPACYCVTGTPAALVTPSTALSASYACTGTCPSPEVAPGAFVIITASFVYVPLLPFYSKLADTTVSETVTARIQ